MFQEICNSSQDPETSLQICHLKDHSQTCTFILKVGKSIIGSKNKQSNIIHEIEN